MENITILIVDDETRMRKLIKDFLVKKDYKTIEAEDGEVALELFEQNKNKINLLLSVTRIFSHRFQCGK